MLISRKFSIIFSAFVASVGIFCATPASAQAPRTWVSGVGDDVNPCSRTAPCKTFAGAIIKTAANGEINCLDPGGFGTLTITKSITIDCSDMFGSTLNSGGVNGFIINDSSSPAPNTSDVVIRGVHINGAGATPGLNGIRFVSGRSLVVENVTIQNQSSRGISIQPGAAARIMILNTSIENTAGGILVQPTGANGTARVNIENLRVFRSTGEAVRADTTGNTGPSTQVNINDSDISSSGTGVLLNSPAGTTGITVMVTRSRIFSNTTGLSATGGTTQLAVGDTVIAGNTTEITSVSGGLIQSFGDNLRIGNVVPGTFSPPTLPKN